MARGKKNEKEITIEERLEQALVPAEEQPYSVPENWCWTRMQNIAQWGSGGTPSRKNPAFYQGNIPWIKTGELNDEYIYETEEHISTEALSSSSAKLFPVNTVIVAMYGATIGKTGILGIEATTNQACACAISSSAIDYKYLFHYARSQKDNFIERGKGGAQPNISQEIIKTSPIPLPPLAEQQRIVDRIESLFAKLDEAKEKAQAVVDGFETRKAAILQEAFTGELTEKWRLLHFISADSWEEKKIGSILKPIKEKYDPTTEKQPDIPYIGLEHMGRGKGITETGSISEVKSLKTVFKKGDVLYGKLRPYLNKHDIAQFSGVCSTDILVYRASSNTTASFFNYVMDTNAFIQYANEHTKGINLPRTSETEISNYSLVVPGKDEQAEIVRILDTLLAKEQQAKEAAEAVLDQIEAMKKSILARAFRGELGTNDPAEESGVELLKQAL